MNKLDITIKGKNNKVVLNLHLEDKPCRGGWIKTFTEEEVLINGRKYNELIGYFSTDMRFYELEDYAKKGYLSTTLREICVINKWDEQEFLEDILEISRKKEENKKILDIKFTTKKGIEFFKSLQNPLIL